MSKYRGNPWVVLIVMSLGFFMTLLDLTIVNIAIPDMISRLHATLDGVLWVINAYALVLAVLLITSGRLGDLFGQRRLFMIGVILFTLASAACGFSPTVGALIAFRAIQGVGAALLLPQTLAILTTVFPPERRGAAFGIWGAVAGVATIAGPTLGGLLVSAFDWRYIFFINLPIGVAVIVLSIFLIPDVKVGARHRLDIPGVLLATGGLLAICYGLVEGQKYNWGKIASFISIPLVIGAGVLLIVVFLVVQARTQDKEPLVPFALFHDRNFSLMNWVSGVLSVGMMGIFLPFTIYLQSALGFSALKAGLTMAPASIISMFVAPVAGRMTDKIGGKYILMSGLMFFAIGFGLTAAHRDDDLDLAGLHLDALHRGHRHGLHVRADDHGGHAQHRAAGGRRGLRHDQHRPASRRGHRHGGGRSTAPEPAGGFVADRRRAARGLAAAGRQEAVRRRIRQVGPARLGREPDSGRQRQAAAGHASLAGHRDSQGSQ